MKDKPKYKPEFQENPFFDLDENKFEDLCCDLFTKSDEVSQVRRLFGSGSAQFGVDILIRLGGCTSNMVAQCKHYPVAKFSRRNIEKAVSEFVSYWDTHWRRHNVIKFYLIVARPITTADQLLTIHQQSELLREGFNVEFIYWDSRDLEKEVEQYPDLVHKYLGEYWEWKFRLRCSNTPPKRRSQKLNRYQADLLPTGAFVHRTDLCNSENIEKILVGYLQPKSDDKFILLYGAMGVGKTALAQMISQAVSPHYSNRLA